MADKFTPKVVTANDLLKGDVVWLTEDDNWSRDIRDAEMIDDEAHATIRLLEAKAQSQRVVGAYLAEARLGPKGPEPTHFRELFRTRGPSNYDHGKQAEV